MNFSRRMLILILKERKEGAAMVLKLQCPECGKGEKSELLEVLSGRKYRMKCGDCGRTYILTASVDKERQSDNQSSKDHCDNGSNKGCLC
jgi:ribosomal protein S27AE